jgi:hypothetical protein
MIKAKRHATMNIDFESFATKADIAKLDARIDHLDVKSEWHSRCSLRSSLQGRQSPPGKAINPPLNQCTRVTPLQTTCANCDALHRFFECSALGFGGAISNFTLARPVYP